ncbi:MAG TPA: hypothetical protein VGQ55_02715 [Pyrinomonadaceae bacterium]|jgi:hypothetical protein|nr:hypothetical protein [Pyrinomonadaceae bacterium]
MQKKLLPALILLLVQTFYFQTIEKTETPDEARARLQKEAVTFLRETQGDVNTMRSLENRISFSSELAGLMWFHDEREAKAMFAAVVADFRELLLKYDAQLNALGAEPENESDPAVYRRGFLGGDPSERGRLMRKLDIALMVRQQIAMSIAEHDGDLAYSFYIDSLSAIANPELRKKAEESSSNFENQLVTQIAKSNAARAAQLATKSLSKGLNYQHLEMLKAIYAKDADKGAEFASALVSRAKDEKTSSSDQWIISSLISFGEQTLADSRKLNGKRPAFTQQDLRDLAEIMASAILNSENTSGLNYLNQIEKYAPGRAIQIRAKYPKKTASGSGNGVANTSGYGFSSAPPPDYSGPVSAANANTAHQTDAQQVEQQTFEDVMKLNKKELPKEEREKIIERARKLIATTPGRERKITGLSALAAQVAAAGDKDLADELLREAESLVNPSPKNYQDFLLTWMLATGYASAKSDRAFTLLDETIQRANSTIDAFVRVGEFIDVAEEMVVDGEVQLGAFGGSMVRGLTGELGMADGTIRILAMQDFGKTKNLTNRFDRTEIRVLAKMMVIRAVLNDKTPDKSKGSASSEEFPMDVEN